MIDLKRLRSEPAAVRAALARRGDAGLGRTLDEVLSLDAERRVILAAVETQKASRNTASQEVARRKKNGESADDLLADLKQSGDEVKRLDQQVREIDTRLDALLLTLPNLPHPDTPEGGPEANRVIRTWGNPSEPTEGCRPHWEIGEALGLLDLPRGAKVAGSGFPVFRGTGARLVRALANFMLELHTGEHGYEEVIPPYLVNQTSLRGTGQFPKFTDEVYKIGDDELYLIPTAEVPVTNLHRDEMLNEGDLPLAYVAFTPCFRREAGAHGKDTRGLIRVHQFDKVELVRLVRPEDSEADHQLLTAHAETVLQRLELPYRVLELAAGDTGFSAARTYDLELWAPGVGAWLEASSASTFTDFQARRAGLRYRPAPGAKPEFVHTLNASGVAFPRTIAALLEVHQQPDGSVRIPDALIPFFGRELIEPLS